VNVLSGEIVLKKNVRPAEPIGSDWWAVNGEERELVTNDSRGRYDKKKRTKRNGVFTINPVEL